MAPPVILIVDDVKVNLILLRSLLGRQDQYTILEAENGADALALARQQPHPHLLLLDVQLPDISGMDICRELKRDPDTARIPIVLVSAIKTDDDSIAEGLEAGAMGYITKPVSEIALRAWVQTALQINLLQQQVSAKSASERDANDLELLSQFSRLSHAVSNPLQSLMSAADLLALELQDNTNAIKALNEIQKFAESIADLVSKSSEEANQRMSSMIP